MKSVNYLLFLIVAVIIPAVAHASVPMISGNNVIDGILSTLIYGVIGLLFGAISFRIIDARFPGDLKHQITQEKNLALAVLVGAQSLGVALIIAAAIAG
jgi:uncharacterized membrane protein YjfL (UPF0719 family)